MLAGEINLGKEIPVLRLEKPHFHLAVLRGRSPLPSLLTGVSPDVLRIGAWESPLLHLLTL